MGRKRTGLKLTSSQRTQLDCLWSTVRDDRKRERLAFIRRAAAGALTLENLASVMGRSRSTLQNWLGKYHSGGLDELLKRGASPGKRSPMAGGRIQGELTKRLKCGQLKTAGQVSSWLMKEHGIRLARKSVYYWLNKQTSGK